MRLGCVHVAVHAPVPVPVRVRVRVCVRLRVRVRARLRALWVRAPTLKLAVLEFHGREILVSVSRQGLTRLAEAQARPGAPAEVLP